MYFVPLGKDQGVFGGTFEISPPQAGKIWDFVPLEYRPAAVGNTLEGDFVPLEASPWH